MRNKVNSVLPKHVETKITFCNYIKSSEDGHKEENKFKVNMRVNIKKEEEIEEYIRALEDRTKTDFKKGYQRTSSAKGWIRNVRCCHRKLRSKYQNQDPEKPRSFGGGGRGAGKPKPGFEKLKPGVVGGRPKQPGKNTECETKISYTFKNNSKVNDYKLNIELDYNHNHKVLTNKNFNFSTVSTETEKEILDMYKTGMVPSKAMRLFRSNLKTQLGEIEFLKVAANRKINPDRNYFFNLYSQFCHKTLGTVNGPDATKKAYDMVKIYNEEEGEQLASMRFTEKNEVVIVVLDPMTKRVHQLVKQSGDIVYIDGTGSLDKLDTQLFKLMTCSPAGGLPLGFMLLGSKDEETIEAGLKEFKSLVKEDAFFRRGSKGLVCNNF